MTVNKPVAHIRLKDREVQDLWTHLAETGHLTGEFAGKIGLKDAGEILGLYHDLGKASNEFQHYLLSATGILDPDADEYIDAVTQKGKIDHSSAGAQAIYKVLADNGSEGAIAAQVLSLCIASHHSGLIDCLAPSGINTYIKRIEKDSNSTHIDEIMAGFSSEIAMQLKPGISNEKLAELVKDKLISLKEENDSTDTYLFKHGLLIRFLFSCLLDADRTNTADFESPLNHSLRNEGRYPSWHTLAQKLDKKLAGFEQKQNKNTVDRMRSQVSQACFEWATKPRGIYQLKVPTGGGKTLSSLRFAINHAEHHNLDRIFYIIPYTSIIDQNADEVRKILEDWDENDNYLNTIVLEHHSNLTPDKESHRQHLLAENWDAPIVFTTQVQFLETLFGAGTRSARRMHQLANSIIIFDEVQTLPMRCIHMFNLAVRFLVQGCGATVVLCTATQPLLDQVLPAQRSLVMTSNQHMIGDETALFTALKRVNVTDRRKVGGWSEDEVSALVVEQLQDSGSVLTVVNTRASARNLFNTLAGNPMADVFHLSTNMCPAHRLETLATIKEKLHSKSPVICISTQLIEAGVDIDFACVIRYLAGLDSIVQASGRCNRSGLRDAGKVFIVNPANENIQYLKDISSGRDIAERILDDYKNSPAQYGNDILGLQALNEYYQYYFFQRRDEMSYPVDSRSPVGRNDNLFNLLSLNETSTAEYARTTGSYPKTAFKQSFRTASLAFQVIDSDTQGVVVPYGTEGKQVIEGLRNATAIDEQARMTRKAQRYSVNLYRNELEKMQGLQAIHEVQAGSGIYYMDEPYYSNEIGWFENAAQ